MDLYTRFLAFEIVINVTNNNDYMKLLQRFKELRLNSVKYLAKQTFTSLHMNAGMLSIPFGELCIEFQLSKGLTIGDKNGYLKWGREICSVEEFLQATEYEE